MVKSCFLYITQQAEKFVHLARMSHENSWRAKFGKLWASICALFLQKKQGTWNFLQNVSSEPILILNGLNHVYRINIAQSAKNLLDLCSSSKTNTRVVISKQVHRCELHD